MGDSSPDPEFPDLDRLIARTVPRSPHARTEAEHRPLDRAPEPDPVPEPCPEPPTPTGAAAASDAPSPSITPTDPNGASLATESAVASDAPSGSTAPLDHDSASLGAASAPEPDGPEPDGPETGEAAPDAAEAALTDVEDLGDELESDAAFEAALEALLLVVDAPVDEAALGNALGQPASRVRAALPRMAGAYTADRRGIDLRRSGEGWRFYTRESYAPYVERMLLDGQRARLTRAALETLAVVAYRQPVTRARVSAVRGVNCDGVLRTLLTRGLVEEAGTDDQTQGTLFRTTELFLERLGLESVQELPPLAPLLPDIDAIDDM